MRTTLVLALPLLVCACAGLQAGALANGDAGAICNAQTAQFALGQPYSDALGENARLRSAAAILRVLRVGEMATQVFNAKRLTMQLDGSRRVAAVRCG